MTGKFDAVFSELNLSKNEGRVYATLLKSGESSVSRIAQSAKVHRRNVYDVLQRLLEKGLVYEIIQDRDTQYCPVDPGKLRELLHEQTHKLESILPDLKALHQGSVQSQQALVYRGLSGWKQYMRDMLLVGKDVHVIGAKAAWLDERVKNFLPWFAHEAGKRKIKFRFLFDHEVEPLLPALSALKLDLEHKFLPSAYSSNSSVDIFGDHVMIATTLKAGKLPEDLAISIMIDPRLAESFRTWFNYLWQYSSDQ